MHNVGHTISYKTCITSTLAVTNCHKQNQVIIIQMSKATGTVNSSHARHQSNRIDKGEKEEDPLYMPSLPFRVHIIVELS